ncbi:MAG: Sir2 family NAD-dependent protein deacetylase [Myxococcota bacterium]
MALYEQLCRETGPLLLVTGAGVSVASGLPVFRGSEPNAVWNQRIIERGTLKYFWEDPAESWSWYLDRFDALLGRKPNPAHHAIAALEAWQTTRGGDFLLVTQNVDALHETAGSRSYVEVHGRTDRVRCAARECELAAPRGSLARDEAMLKAFRQERTEANLPRCPSCGELLRPHVLWFDERYDGHVDFQIARVLRAAKRARTILFAGTSFSVGVTAMIVETGLRRGAKLFSIDPSGRIPHQRVHVIAEPAEEALPTLVSRLPKPVQR